MGTDIYLSWDKQTEEEKKAQITGYNIEAGSKGYLRASIGMVKGNHLLRLIFPDEFWKKYEELPYDFQANFNKMLNLGFQYLLSVVFGIDIQVSEEQKKQTEMVDRFLEIIKGYSKVICHRESDFPFAVCWLNSLIEFFELGIEKQEENLNPKVRISW